jgi:uncharacterized protein
MSIPVTTLFVGLHSVMAVVLSNIVVTERTRTQVWHGASIDETAAQPNWRNHPGKWAAMVGQYIDQKVTTKSTDDGLLQRKIRAYGNFIEHVPLGLLLILVLELMSAPVGLLWFLGLGLAIGRMAHAWGVINTYGPSVGRALGFYLTWLVYLVGAIACFYYGITGLGRG